MTGRAFLPNALRWAMLRRGSLLCGLLIWGSLGGTAHGRPSIWERAREPELARSYATLVRIERLRLSARERLGQPSLFRDYMLGIVALYELSGFQDLPNAEIGFLLGNALLYAGDERIRDARELLELALERAPDSPLAAGAWFDVAIASAKLGEPEPEQRAYEKALELEWDRDARAMIYINRGERRMLLGDLRGAIFDYELSLSRARRPEAQALALYGLAVALERSGDLPSALSRMRVASTIRPPRQVAGGSMLDSPLVFFEPEYEIHYYKALEALAAARVARDPAEARVDYRAVAEHFARYVAQAAREAEPPPWLTHARLHLQQAERELSRLEAERERDTPDSP